MLRDVLYTTVGPGTAMMGLRPEQHPVWPSSNVIYMYMCILIFVLLETELLYLATVSPFSFSHFQLLDVGSPSHILREAIKISV